MKPIKILDFENNGVCTVIDEEFIYLGSKGAISKYQLADMSLKEHIIVNDMIKNTTYSGFWFQIHDDYIFARDFCDLHIIQKKNLQLLYSVRLGENASSDVCGITDFKFPIAYVKLRNSKFEIFDVNTKETAQIEVSNASSWSSCIHEDRIYYSTTNGELLELERYTLREIRKMQLTKKMNTYSVVFHNNMLYTTSEKGFKVVDIDTFELTQYRRNVFSSTEASILGIYKDAFVVVERKKIAIFDIKTLTLQNRFDFPTGYRYMRYAILKGDMVYGSDECGIYCFNLDIEHLI